MHLFYFKQNTFSFHVQKICSNTYKNLPLLGLTNYSKIKGKPPKMKTSKNDFQDLNCAQPAHTYSAAVLIPNLILICLN